MNPTGRWLLVAALGAASMLAQSGEFQFDADGSLRLPDYRQWVFLSSGLGMTYGPAASMSGGAPLFDNVFVNPSSYRSFLESGRWPDKTMFVLEIRASRSHGSINKGGNFQSDIVAIEAEVKDEKRFPKKWGFFGFDGRPGEPAAKAQRLASEQRCQQCHAANGAVEQTFVQFYPALMPVAEKKGTVNSFYKPMAASPVQLFQLANHGGWPGLKKTLDQLQASDPGADTLEERSLNQLGYWLLGEGKKAEAVGVFEWAAAHYPASANALDSLAEAYAGVGRPADAIAATERGLRLLGADTSTPAARRELIAQSLNKRLASLKKN